MSGAQAIQRLLDVLHNRAKLACIDIGDVTGDNLGALVFGNEPPNQALRQVSHILLQCGDIRAAQLLGKPAPQCLDRPDIAHPRLLLHDRVHLVEHRKRLWIVRRGVGRQVDQHRDGVGPGELRIELMAGRDGLLLVRHLIREPVTGVQIGIGEPQPGDHDQADQAVNPWPGHDAQGNPVTEGAQRVHADIRSFDARGEDFLPPDQQNA